MAWAQPKQALGTQPQKEKKNEKNKNNKPKSR